MSWAFGELAPFDVETTGVDVDTARIVTAAVGHIVPRAEAPVVTSYLVAVDVEIPAEATEVHGITTEQARAEGLPAAEVLESVAGGLCKLLDSGVPLVGMNLAFDLTILDRELRRNGLVPLDVRLGRPVAPVIDVYVVDKAVDRYRRGSRRLPDLCAHYGVRHGEAHDAAADALGAARVAYELCRRATEAFIRLGSMSLVELHEAQRGWYREQAESLAAYFRQKANEEEHRAGRIAEAGEHAAAMQQVESLRDRADGVVTEWPMAAGRP